MAKKITKKDIENKENSAAITVAAPCSTVSLGIPVSRHWGSVTLLEESQHYRISRLTINPGHHITKQMHYHRSEHWVVVSGTAKVTQGDDEAIVIQNQSTYVPACTIHCVENPGVIPLVLIEVQNGEFLGDEDITRFDFEA